MITPPAFKKDAVPTSRGWTDPKTGELLVSRPLTQDDIDEYNGVTAVSVAPAKVIHPDPVVVEEEVTFLTEADPVEEVAEADEEEGSTLNLDKLSLRELKNVADRHGVSYGMTTRKGKLLERLKKVL
jgi:hypothetical protein